jgi:hypothetical protein
MRCHERGASCATYTITILSQDVAPFVEKFKNQKKGGGVWMPFYYDGQCGKYLTELGFKNVVISTPVALLIYHHYGNGLLVVRSSHSISVLRA